MSPATTAPPRPSAPHIAVRPDWLALQREAPLEPGLPIVDSHHHLWVFPDKVYRASDLLADMAAAHRIVSTVFVECKTSYLVDGPEEFRSIGEIDFVNNERIAARALDSGADVAAACVGHADLSLGERVAPCSMLW